MNLAANYRFLVLGFVVLLMAGQQTAEAHTTRIAYRCESNGSVTLFAGTYHFPSSPIGGIVVDGNTSSFTSVIDPLPGDVAANEIVCASAGALANEQNVSWQTVNVAGLASGSHGVTTTCTSAVECPWGPDCLPGSLSIACSTCSNGSIEGGEQCDEGVANGTASSCCTASCTYRNVGETCRPAAGACDGAESCTGSSGACPTDAKSTAQCRASAGVCDPAESCDGVGDDCPADAKSTGECRASAGVCDPAESCDGVGDNCPADAKSTAQCRASAGVCDPAESCDGIGDNCPADGKSTAQCRASAGVCDPAESCDGVADDCPADAKSTAECRASAGVCDPAESCDGAGDNCPADQKSTAVCRPAAGVCDLSESCDSVNNDCPADAKSTALCRADAGECDVPDFCDGAGDDCPADGFEPSGHACGSSADDECTDPDTCDGAGMCQSNHAADDTPCHGANNNTCLNTCQTGACTPDFIADCCGNGVTEGGEECDDGNQVSGSDLCPSDPAFDCQYTISGDLIRGTNVNPATDRKGCQLEWFALNPSNPLDRYGLPNRDQSCTDQDPTCDGDPTPGRCRLTVVLCLNNDDSNLPACAPAGVSSVEVLPPRLSLGRSPIIDALALANTNQLAAALATLFDPNNPGAGFTNTPPLAASQVNLCSAPLQLDVLAASAKPNESRRARFSVYTKSQDASTPAKTKRSRLRLTCLARPLP